MKRLPALALLGATLLAGCASEVPAPKAELRLKPSTTTTTEPEMAAFAALLPPEVGDRLRPADDVLGTGPLDLDAAARAGTEPTAERKALAEHGFRQGVSRAWAAPPSDTVYVALYEFGSPAGAQRYHAAQVEALARRGAAPTPVTAPAGAHGFTTVEGKLTTHAALFAQRTHWVLVLAASEQGSFTAAHAAALAGTVAGRL